MPRKERKENVTTYSKRLSILLLLLIVIIIIIIVIVLVTSGLL